MHQENQFSFTGFVVWIICALFFTYEFLLRTVLGTFQHPIMYDLSLSPLKFAILSTTSFLMIYGLMQLPVGMLTDRFGLKRSLIFAVCVCALSTVLFSFTYQFKTAVLIRMLMGLGASFGFVCLLVSVYDWMPKRHYGLFIGLSQFIGVLGPMIAAGPLDSLAERGNTDWRTIIFSLGLIGIALFFFIILLVKNNEGNVGKFRIIHKPTTIRSNLSSLLRQKQTWLIAIYSALVYFTIEYLSENEGKAFIILNGFDSIYASYMITIGWLGYAIGCPLLGFLSDYLKRRKLMLIIAACISLISIILIVYFPVSKLILAGSFLLLGLGAGGQSIGFAIMAEQCGKDYLAVGLGFNNAMITILSSINAPLIGWLLDNHRQTEALALDDYHYAFSFIVVLISLSIFVSIFFIKETYCRPTKGFTLIN